MSAEMPLLWVLRDTLGLTGTKFGCGLQLCGACTVHVDGVATRSCGTPISTAAGKNITTIEGLSADTSHAVQRAWIEVDVPQCGYCQSGQIMSAAALLARKASPRMPTLIRRCAAICVAAEPIPISARLFIRPRPGRTPAARPTSGNGGAK